MTEIRTALVIGGGLAGPVTALALAKAGIEPTVYEAYGSTADGIGGTLTVAPNGLDALRIVGAEEAVRAIGQPMAHTVMADGRGRRMGEFSGLPDLPPSQAMWRSELYRALHDHALAQGIRIEYGKRLVGVDDTPTGITARFADGGTASGDVLIGADGIRSTVRTLIDPDAPDPDDVPLLNFGAAADIAVPAKPDATYFVFGRRAFLGYWVQPDGRTAWYGNLPHDKPMTSAQAREVPAADWLHRLREVYADDVPGRDLLQHTSADQLVALGSIEIMPKLPHWHRGRMVLVGDSAHAPSPSSGQGASLAAESAVQLARCLRDLPDLPSAFAAYERLRRPRVEKVAARAAKTNNSKSFGPVATTLMGLLMPIAMKTFLTPEKMLGPEQRHRIGWDEVVTA
ncbi:MAG TPA: NAD(P)/FAD-dependent oxidoreductase [Actinomadura sp.]|jgi:2-polyprenyl-6-methoxyphenol hydroxylase-like FAD-dependent oxidoreductase|nr:NAD(P)/FAD-dependent oxidoreductase [Actinomadura sp.]